MESLSSQNPTDGTLYSAPGITFSLIFVLHIRVMMVMNFVEEDSNDDTRCLL